ncbi:MAG TPA: sugar ABC transporter permease [Thermoanaerobaculia bacterium]|nr:sugar ABC transporter permease [Thermoanaerobaculia bacterium]
MRLAPWRPTAKRAALGLLLAALLGTSALEWAAGRAEKGLARQQAERQGAIAVRALADLVGAAGGTGEAVRGLAARFAATGLDSIRVIAFEGLSLEASTHPADTGDKAAPRRLAREEKDLYDQGQRLRAAVETNRQEGVARKEELEVTRLDSALALAAPVEIGGEIAGAVLARAPAEKPPRARSWVQALLLALVPVLLFLPLAWALGDRKWLSTAVAALLLVASLVWLGQRTLERLGEARRSSENEIAARVASVAELARGAAGELSLAGLPADPASWDGDRYRRPRGLVATDGTVDAAALAADLAAGRSRSLRYGTLAGALGLGLLAFVALGAAGRVGRTLKRHREAYLYTLPALLGMLFLVYFPFFYGITLSFTGATLYNEDKPLVEKWVGFENYQDILGDFSVVKTTEEGRSPNYENFYWTLGFTVVWTLTNVTWGVSIGLILALVLNTKGLFARPIYRVLLVLPWAVPNYITALVWKGMFHQQLGVVNQIVQMFGGTPISWFEQPFTSFLAIFATNGWLSFPFMMVISLGALQSIPGELYEAARVDGATKWQQFKAITLPSLKPALVPAIILSVIWTFNMFNIPYLTSAGEPAHATEILVTQAYKVAFEKYQHGYAAAYAVIIFLILLAYGTWQNRVTRATESIG